MDAECWPLVWAPRLSGVANNVWVDVLAPNQPVWGQRWRPNTARNGVQIRDNKLKKKEAAGWQMDPGHEFRYAAQAMSSRLPDATANTERETGVGQ